MFHMQFIKLHYRIIYSYKKSVPRVALLDYCNLVGSFCSKTPRIYIDCSQPTSSCECTAGAEGNKYSYSNLDKILKHVNTNKTSK